MKTHRIRKYLVVFLAVFAGPFLALLDIFILSPTTTVARVERIYRKEVFTQVGRTTRRVTYSFIETDTAPVLQVETHWPAEEGKQIAITRSALLGIVLKFSDWNNPLRERRFSNWKVLAGFSIITVLLGIAFLLTRFDIRFGIAAVIGHACVLAFLWVMSKL